MYLLEKCLQRKACACLRWLLPHFLVTYISNFSMEGLSTGQAAVGGSIARSLAFLWKGTTASERLDWHLHTLTMSLTPGLQDPFPHWTGLLHELRLRLPSRQHQACEQCKGPGTFRGSRIPSSFSLEGGRVCWILPAPRAVLTGRPWRQNWVCRRRSLIRAVNLSVQSYTNGIAT